jgi:hypothetical protein
MSPVGDFLDARIVAVVFLGAKDPWGVLGCFKVPSSKFQVLCFWPGKAYNMKRGT